MPALKPCSNALPKPACAHRQAFGVISPTLTSVLSDKTAHLFKPWKKPPCTANHGHAEHQTHGVPLRNRNALLTPCSEHTRAVLPSLNVPCQIQKLELVGSSHESSQTPDGLFMQSEQESMNNLEGNSLCKTEKGKESRSIHFLATDLGPQEVPGPAMPLPPQLPVSWWREAYREQTVTFKEMTN